MNEGANFLQIQNPTLQLFRRKNAPLVSEVLQKIYFPIGLYLHQPACKAQRSQNQISQMRIRASTSPRPDSIDTHIKGSIVFVSNGGL